MKNLYIYCEGQTEESFINTILYPYFFNMGICVFPIICFTRRSLNKKYKGGVTSYEKIKSELKTICRQHRNEMVTTMFDYYGMPTDTPSIECSEVDLLKRMEFIEGAISRDIGERNCIFHLMLHEFEALLFSEPQAFSLIGGEDAVRAVQEICSHYETPEHINNSVETAPSKRIGKIIPNYAKVKNGVLLSQDIGIDKMMAACPHFKRWIETIIEATK